MIKVLIVDDEFRVCQLICNLIDWGSLDMQIIGVAHNGIEARELARETVPDLVITDIRMPGCTGLELVEQLREIYRSVSFIIISGVTQSTINNIVSGRNRSTTIVTIKKLCDGLGISIVDFFNHSLFFELEQEIC